MCKSYRGSVPVGWPVDIVPCAGEKTFLPVRKHFLSVVRFIKFVPDLSVVQAKQSIFSRRNQKYFIRERDTGCFGRFYSECISKFTGHERIFPIAGNTDILICFIEDDTIAASGCLQMFCCWRDIRQSAISPLSFCIQRREFLSFLIFSGNTAKHHNWSVHFEYRNGGWDTVIISGCFQAPDYFAVPVPFHTPWYCFRRGHADDYIMWIERINCSIWSAIKLIGFWQAVLFIFCQRCCWKQNNKSNEKKKNGSFSHDFTSFHDAPMKRKIQSWELKAHSFWSLCHYTATEQNPPPQLVQIAGRFEGKYHV